MLEKLGVVGRGEVGVVEAWKGMESEEESKGWDSRKREGREERRGKNLWTRRECRQKKGKCLRRL